MATISRCPLCQVETGEPPRGVNRNALTCSGCLVMTRRERMMVAAHTIVQQPYLPEERLRILAKMLAEDVVAVLVAIGSVEKAMRE